MARQNPDLVPGQELRQEEIEEAFDTSFGYHIKGINVRQCSMPRIVILFTETSPYQDSLQDSDTFEYIGEGIEGNQSEETVGNKTLLDARSKDIPIFVFSSDDDFFTYLGRGQVEECDTVEKNSNNVLVFTIRLIDRSSNDKTVPNLFIAPVENLWRYRNYVRDPINISDYEDVPYQFHSKEELRLWAFDDKNRSTSTYFDDFYRGDYVLFYHKVEILSGGRIAQYTQDPSLGQKFWENPCNRHIVEIEEFSENVISLENLWTGLEFEERWTVDGFTKVPLTNVANLRNHFSDINEAIFKSQDGKESADLESNTQSEHGCSHGQEYKEAINPGITLGVAGFSLGRSATRIFCHECGSSYKTDDSFISKLHASSASALFGSN